MTLPSEPLNSSWFGQGYDARLSLKEFSDSMQPYLTSITNIQCTLLEVRVPFEAGDVQPFQCRQAISMLIELKKKLEQWCHLMRETSTIPVVMMALRYSLLEELHYLEEQTDKLINRISDYCSACMTSSQRAIRQGQAIDKLFERHLRHITDMPQKVKYLVRDAYLQEERLTSIST